MKNIECGILHPVLMIHSIVLSMLANSKGSAKILLSSSSFNFEKAPPPPSSLNFNPLDWAAVEENIKQGGNFVPQYIVLL